LVRQHYVTRPARLVSAQVAITVRRLLQDAHPPLLSRMAFATPAPLQKTWPARTPRSCPVPAPTVALRPSPQAADSRTPPRPHGAAVPPTAAPGRRTSAPAGPARARTNDPALPHRRRRATAPRPDAAACCHRAPRPQNNASSHKSVG
jgi:hypothetical protein